MSDNMNMRELSMDEMDKVSGGTKTAPSDYTFKGLTQWQAGDILQGLVDAFGIDMAIDWANENWVRTQDWETYMRESADRNAGHYAAHRIWGKAYCGGY